MRWPRVIPGDKVVDPVDIVISFDWHPMVGGAHGWVESIYRHWPTRVDVLTCAADGKGPHAPTDFPDQSGNGALVVHRIAVPVPDIDFGSLDFWRRILANRSRLASISRGRPATLHALRAFPEGFLACAFAAIRGNVRVITYAHGEELMVARTSRLLSLIARWVYRRSTRVIANSHYTARLVADLERSSAIAVSHPCMIPHDLPDRGEARAALRRRHGWNLDAIVVVCIARMEARKNHLAVVNAIADARAEGLDVVAVCAGDGPEFESIHRHVVDQGLEDYVSLPGRISDEDKWGIMTGGDIFAMPSIQVGPMLEGFGIVFLEAAWAGLPSVSGVSGGQIEAVLDGRTGLNVDGTSRAAVSAGIIKLARDVGLRNALAEAGRKHAIQFEANTASRKVWGLLH